MAACWCLQSPGRPLFEVSLESTCAVYLGAFQRRRVHTDHYEANQKFGYLVGCVHSNHCWQGPFSSRGHYCRAGCCLPGFVWTTICIHLMDCQGRGSPPEETVEWLLSKPLRGRGALIPAFAQVLERAGLLARCSINTTGSSEALDAHSQTPFIVCSDRDPGSPLTGREWPGCSGSDAMSRPWPAGSCFVASSGGLWLSSSLQSDLVVAFFQSSPMGFPCKPLSCHLPSSVWLDTVKSLQRGQGLGVGGEDFAHLLQRRLPPPPPPTKVNTFSCQNALPSSTVLSFLARQEVFGVLFLVFFRDVSDAWW